MTRTTATAGVAERLAGHALAFPDKPAVIHGERVLTFAELDAGSDRYAAGLHRAGIGKGTRTVLMLRPGPELFTVLFGLVKLGAVPVVVDPGMGVRRMLHCYRAAGAEAFIGIPVAHAVRVFNRRAFRGVHTLVTAGRRWFWGGDTLDSLPTGPPPHPTVGPDDLLMIGFTTGSTGPAKGVESTHGALAAMVDQVVVAHEQSPDDVALVTSPMFGILHLLIGSTCVLAPVDPTRVAGADPAVLADVIERHEVSAMFASPALLDPFGRHLAETGRKLPSLRCLVSGGAPVSDEIVASLHNGHTRFHTTYGATEALPIASIDSDEILGQTRALTRTGSGTCVGRPVDGIEVRVTRITDEPMPTWSDDLLAAPGDVGEITIAGPTVSRSYHRLPAANAAHKIAEGDRVWHRTGDLGRLDDHGRLWFCGRKTQRVGDRHTVQVEGVLNAHPDVRRTALVSALPATTSGKLWPRRGREGTTSPTLSPVEGTPVVVVEPRPGLPAAERPRVAGELADLASRHDVTTGLHDFLFHPSFPVDIRHNAKINREYLSTWATATRRPPRGRAARAIPVLGWAFLVYGLVGPMPHPALWVLWWIDAFLSIVVHAAQVPTGIRRGRPAGVTAGRSAGMTFVFGATWWKALP